MMALVKYIDKAKEMNVSQAACWSLIKARHDNFVGVLKSPSNSLKSP